MGIKISEMPIINAEVLQQTDPETANSSLVEISSLINSSLPVTNAIPHYVLTRRIIIPLRNLGSQPHEVASVRLAEIPFSIFDNLKCYADTENTALATDDIMCVSGTLRINASYSFFEAWRPANIDFYLSRDDYGNFTGKFKSKFNSSFDSFNGPANVPFFPSNYFGAPDIAIHGFELDAANNTYVLLGKVVFDSYSTPNIPQLLVHGHLDLEITIANLVGQA